MFRPLFHRGLSNHTGQVPGTQQVSNREEFPGEFVWVPAEKKQVCLHVEGHWLPGGRYLK